MPSIGSTIQRRPPLPADDDAPYSSPKVASPGRSVPSRSLRACPVSLRDGGEVGLGLDDEIVGAKAREGDLVGDVRQLQRQREVLGGDDAVHWR